MCVLKLTRKRLNEWKLLEVNSCSQTCKIHQRPSSGCRDTMPTVFGASILSIITPIWCLRSIKRLNGVPDYYYFDSEMPESYDRKNLKLYTYSYRDRMIFYFSAMIRPLMSKSSVIWWFLNFSTDVNEFFIRNFPIFAFIKFGFKNSYVSDGL